MVLQLSYRNILGAAFHDEPLTFKDWPGVTYFIYGEEICPTTKRKHLQFYCEFRSSKRGTAIKKRYPKLRLEERKGSQKNNQTYCKKDGKFVEWGTPNAQGTRVDLKALVTQVLAGTTTVEDVLVDQPMMYHQYGRTLRAAEDRFFRSTFRTEMTTCTWIYGPTAVGKSHRAYANYDPSTSYNYPFDGDWWDGYRGEHTVIINDFRGQIKYDHLLRLIDKWPMKVRCRNQQPRPFTSKHIIITSSKHPSACYPNRAEDDDIAQLLRRITVEHITEPYDGDDPIPTSQSLSLVLPQTTSAASDIEPTLPSSRTPVSL